MVDYSSKFKDMSIDKLTECREECNQTVTTHMRIKIRECFIENWRITNYVREINKQ